MRQIPGPRAKQPRLRSSAAVVVALLALTVCGAGAAADTVLIGPDRDNTLYEDPEGAASNGAGPNFFAGQTLMNTSRRGVIHFDIAAAIPAGSTITDATLTLHVSRTSTGTEAVTLHRLLSDWGEGTSVAFDEGGRGGPSTDGDATWIHTFFQDRFWQNPGGDFDPQQSVLALVGGVGFFTWSTSEGDPGIAPDIQSWLDHPSTNFGWLVQGDESFPQAAKRFDSRENPDETLRPVLSITYTPACVADTDGDGSVNINDFLTFLSRYAAGDPRADIDRSGTITVQDFLAYLQHFAAGC
jgi:hypothetical protein